MLRGVTYAAKAAATATASEAGWGARGVLDHAGDAWAEYAGGTSGVLWGAGLRALGAQLGNEGTPDAAGVSRGMASYLDAIVGLGKADLGDKTLVDAASPFVAELERRVAGGEGLPAAWSGAAVVAETAARATAALSPKKGRARPLAERSIGTPDPGAVSFALCALRVAELLEEQE